MFAASTSGIGAVNEIPFQKVKRKQAIENAFKYDDPYDVILALDTLTYEKGEQLGVKFGQLSRSDWMVFHVLWFDSEVANSGFYQLFINPTGDYALDMLETLETIGAEETGVLFKQALSIFPSGQPARDHDERLAQLKPVTPEQIDMLHTLDEVYYNQDEYIFELAAAYLSARKLDFI